jgi:hypothetical protein
LKVLELVLQATFDGIDTSALFHSVQVDRAQLDVWWLHLALRHLLKVRTARTTPTTAATAATSAAAMHAAFVIDAPAAAATTAIAHSPLADFGVVVSGFTAVVTKPSIIAPAAAMSCLRHGHTSGWCILFVGGCRVTTTQSRRAGAALA